MTATAPKPPQTDTDAFPPLREAVPLGLQHVLAMFASNLTPAFLLATAVEATPEQRTLLVQGALLCAGLATLLQTIGFSVVGGRLPIMMGSGFVFISVAVPLAAERGLAAVWGAALVTALVQVLIALNIHRIAWLFPPLVTGTIILVIGLGLLPSAFTLAAGGATAPDFGAAGHLGLAAFVLVLAVVLNRWGPGLLGTAAVLVSLVAGYLVALAFGMVDLAGVGPAGWVAVPTPFAFGLSFDVIAIFTMAVVGVVNMVDSVGTVNAVTQAGAQRPATRRELRGGILAEGCSAAIGAVFSALPTTMFSQNIGLIALTRQMSRHVVTIAAGVLVAMALLPKAAAVIGATPPAVLGGGVVLLFGMVCAIGIQMLVTDGIDQRALVIVALSVGLGRGLAGVPDLLALLPGQWRPLLESGVVVAAVVAVLLNLVLPGRPRRPDTALA
ncbi:solute carrier family 23 protein [Pseudonocardia sp. NPDC046786]|uniref:uracil-xanthine permease family protein n=1 Tax=Pseudonocardia sp. NPDC046786 TaxID=3155471 RepID=UPI003409FE19